MKNKIFEILKESIKTFDNIDKIKTIATFGSMVKKEGSDFDDLDVITISNKRIHDGFISHLKAKFKEKGFEPTVFNTIIQKPWRKDKNHILIHDLHYKSLSDLKKREWKTVINTMKSEMFILHGDKNFPKNLPYFETSKKELLKNIVKWAKKINSAEEFEKFQRYLKKIIPKFLRDYKSLELGNLKRTQKLLKTNISWEEKLDKTKKLLES